MEIKKMQISQISKADYNPRVELKPGDPVYEKLKNSIQTFGFCEPLIFNRRTGHLVGGHQRLAVRLTARQINRHGLQALRLSSLRA